MAVYGGLRSARWLKSFQQAPMVTAFRNLESGQVLFSQTLHPQQFYIDQQFKWPNWQNKKPTVRKDIWRPLAVAEMSSYEQAVKLYRSLVNLRHRRDMHERDLAMSWRRKNDEGNVWFANQYRPTYTFEAVADLVSAIEGCQGADEGKAIVHWDTEYRKGDSEHWKNLRVEHCEIPRHNPREQFVVLNEIRKQGLERVKDLKLQDVPDSEFEAVIDRQRRIYEARLRARDKLLASRPDLAQLAEKGEAVRQAAYAVRDAKAAFDPYTPRGQRGAAKLPIKLREKTLRQAKRQYRELKRRIAGRTKKRRVPQPRARMRL